MFPGRKPVICHQGGHPDPPVGPAPTAGRFIDSALTRYYRDCHSPWTENPPDWPTSALQPFGPARRRSLDNPEAGD